MNDTNTSDASKMPFPTVKIAVLSSILLCNAIINTILLPFVAFMLVDFGFSDDELGKYSGYLISSFMLGQLLFSHIWGSLSDRFGRRPILLIALVLTSFAILAFGFSTNYKMAIALRFITGSVNGIMGVSKTYVAEITNEHTQGRAFSVLGLNRAMGLLIGPVIGGMLSNPASKLPGLFPEGSIFHTYPYCLPTIIAFLLSSIGTVVAYFVLEESLPSMQIAEREPLLGNVHRSMDDVPATITNNDDLNVVDIVDVDVETPTTKSTSIFTLLKDRAIFSSILIYCIIQLYHVVYDESFVLWSRLDRSKGGIGWKSEQIGSAFSFGGLILLFFQAFAYHRIEGRFGPLKTFRFGVLQIIPSFIVLPRTAAFLANGVTDAKELNSQTVWVYVLVYACIALRSVASLQAYTSVFILIANAAPVSSRGAVNGFAQSAGSLSQIIGPIIGGYIFSASVGAGGFGVELVFDLLVGCSFVAYFASLYAPDSILRRRVEATG